MGLSVLITYIFQHFSASDDGIFKQKNSPCCSFEKQFSFIVHIQASPLSSAFRYWNLIWNRFPVSCLYASVKYRLRKNCKYLINFAERCHLLFNQTLFQSDHPFQYQATAFSNHPDSSRLYAIHDLDKQQSPAKHLL